MWVVKTPCQAACSLLEEKSSLRDPGRGVWPLSDAYYRQPGTESGRIILENDCLILQIFHTGKAETRKEVAMTVTMDWQREREGTLLQAYREELVERIGRAITSDGFVQPLPGLHLYRHSVPLEHVYSVVDPSACLVAQGSKGLCQN